MKTKNIIHVLLQGLLALQVCHESKAADIDILSSAATITIEAVEGDKTDAKSTMPTWAQGGISVSRVDHSAASGAIQIAGGGGIFTGSGRMSLSTGEIDFQQSVNATGTETVFILMRLGGLGFNYHLWSQVTIYGNLEGEVSFAGLVNTGAVVSASGFVPPGEYEFIAGMSTGTAIAAGKGTWIYSLSLTPVSVPREFSEAQKEDLFLASSNLKILCSALTAAADGAAEDQRAVLLHDAAEQLRIANALEQDAEDPMDTNYTAQVQAVVPAITPFAASNGVTQLEADTYNLWQTNLSLSHAYSAALTTALNRAQGAAYAGDAHWKTAQMNAAVQFEAQLASLLDQEPTLRSNVVAQFQSGGFPGITVTTNDAIALQTQIISNGLPAVLLDGLTAHGVDPDTITNLQNTLLTADPDAFAGGFPASLANTNLDSIAHTLAADLRDASLVLINASVLPGGQFRFDLPTQPGYTYNIQFTQNPAQPNAWTTLFTTNATTALLTFTNTPATGAATGFYRATHN
jgi:hypothetical protein